MINAVIRDRGCSGIRFKTDRNSNLVVIVVVVVVVVMVFVGAGQAGPLRVTHDIHVVVVLVVAALDHNFNGGTN